MVRATNLLMTSPATIPRTWPDGSRSAAMRPILIVWITASRPGQTLCHLEEQLQILGTVKERSQMLLGHPRRSTGSTFLGRPHVLVEPTVIRCKWC